MSTAINVTVGDIGLPARNKQQVAANRQAFVQNAAAEKSTALGLTQRSQDRVSQGRDPASGAPLIPPTSAGVLGTSGSSFPRFDQQPAANRLSSSPWPELWVCDFLVKLITVSFPETASDTKYYRGRSKSNNKPFDYLANVSQSVVIGAIVETSVANLTIGADAKGSFLAYTPNPIVLTSVTNYFLGVALGCTYQYKDYPELFTFGKTLNRSTNSFKFKARTFNPSRQFDAGGGEAFGKHAIEVALNSSDGISFSFRFDASWDSAYTTTLLIFNSTTTDTGYELDAFPSTYANLGEWFDLELRLTNGNQYALLVDGNTLSSGILPEQIPKKQYSAFVSKNLYYLSGSSLGSISLLPIYIGESSILFS